MLYLIFNRTSRYVLSEQQLLDAVLESLEKYQTKLKGITPANINLWNNVKKGKLRPKNENHLSDNLKMHLQDDFNLQLVEQFS